MAGAPTSAPWKPVIEDGKLYGRGSADDGYAVYAALTVIAAIDAQATPRPRCVGFIETCEESGSPDLPAYLELLTPRFGDVQLVVGLDSGCRNYEQLWVTTSLRGLVGGTLTVEILSEGVHSGHASGIVPSSFRIARQLLNRLDDPASGRVLLPELHAEIPAERVAQARDAGAILGEAVWKEFPWVSCSHGPDGHSHALPVTTDPVEGILNRTWRPALAVTGAAGLPSIDSAGNVLRPKTTLKLSMRIPPTIDGAQATRALQQALTEDPPYNAKVTFDADCGATGWNAPATAPWLRQALEAASRQVYRQGRSVDRRGRHDPVHEHAGRTLSRGAVPDHRRAGAAFKRARSERVPAHRVRQAVDRRGRNGGRVGALTPARRLEPALGPGLRRRAQKPVDRGRADVRQFEMSRRALELAAGVAAIERACTGLLRKLLAELVDDNGDMQVARRRQ